MRIIRQPICALFCGIVLAAGAFGQDVSQWQEYSYPEYGFAVRAPSRPQVQVNSASEVFINYFTSSDHKTWLVMWVDLLPPGEPRNESQVLEAEMRKATSSEYYHDVVLLNPEARLGHPCRSIEFTEFIHRHPDRRMHEFFCVANGRLYHVRAKASVPLSFPPQAAEVIGSLRIVEMEAAPKLPTPQSPPPAIQAPAKGSLRLVAKPSHAQAYLDSKFAGMTGDDGELVMDAETGTHHLRVSLLEYKDWKRDVTISGGQVTSVEAALEPAGPKPLGKNDILELLKSGSAKTHIIAFINDYGIDFGLTDEIEQDLRSHGADDAILLAIAKASRRK
jgi:PEGA domain-containing protein